MLEEGKERGVEVGHEVEEGAGGEADRELPAQPRLAGQALGVVAGELAPVVDESDRGEAAGDYEHQPDDWLVRSASSRVAL